MTVRDRTMHELLSTGRGFAAAALVLVAACNADSGTSDTGDSLDTDDQKVSYGIGYSVGQSLVLVADRIDLAALGRGFRDALDEADPAVPADELDPLMQSIELDLMELIQMARAADAEASITDAELFLARNGNREGVTTTDSGLQYEIFNQGTGPKPGPEDRVTVHYRGSFVDGTQFDSSYDRDEPTTFGIQGVIAGFSEGLRMMPVGSKYKLFIPPDIGYGPAGNNTIPPNAVLIFEIELLGIE